MPNYGTLATLDTLASSLQSVALIGEGKAFASIDIALQAHNRIMREIMGDFVEVTTDRMRRYGGSAAIDFDELDEYGTPDAQKIAAGVNVGFPLRLYGTALQWTRKYFQNATGAELAAQFTSLMDADRRLVIREIKKALFRPANYTSTDRLVDNLSAITLPVKALVNADGAAIPNGPNGEVFDGTVHTHYLAVNGLTPASLQAAVETVIEHFATGMPCIYINRADEAAIRAFGIADFQPLYDTRLTVTNQTTYQNGELDPMALYNRQIGLFHGAEIWVKPWMVPGYQLCWVRGVPPPLCLRERNTGSADMVIAAEDEEHPLRARFVEREFGVGTFNRVGAAILNSTNVGYTQPAITA